MVQPRTVAAISSYTLCGRHARSLQHVEAVIRIAHHVHDRLVPHLQSRSRLHPVHLGQPVAGSLHEQHRHVDVPEVIGSRV